MLEQLGNIRLQSLDPPRQGFVLLAGPTASLFGDGRLDLLTQLRQRSENCQIDLFEDVKHTELVRDQRPQFLEYLGVKW